MASEDNYLFTRDFLDNTRLNLMHHIWTKIFGYNIHPRIPTESANLRIADVATGTGMWVLDVHDSLKNATLDGFDISFDAAPPSQTLPSRVKWRHWHIKEAVPEDLIGVYNIVHVRFLAWVLVDDDMPAFVSKLFSLLRPGGYIQWGEADHQTLHFAKTTPEGSTENTVSLYKLLYAQDPRLHLTWATKIPDLLTDGGFVDVEKDSRDALPHLAFIFHEAGLMIHELIARKTQNDNLAREVKRLLPAVVKETKQGSYGTARRYTIIGKKP